MNNQIEQIEKLEHKLSERKSHIKEQIAKEYYSKYTYNDLRKLWNKYKKDPYKRYDLILDKNPNFHHALEKLDSYGGLRSGELEDEIIKDDDFDNPQWIDFHELFDEYLKESNEDE